MPYLRNGFSKSKLIKPGNSASEDNFKNNKNENQENNCDSICVNAYAGNMHYSK
jgi:hypothetical protein